MSKAPVKKTPRKVIQIEAIPMEHSMLVYVLCNDGTIWASNPDLDKPWIQLPPIPQDGDQ